MKSIKYILLPLLLLLLCSCGTERSEYLNYQSYPLRVLAEAEYGGESYTFSLSLEGDGSCRMDFLEPETLSGFSLSRKDGEMSLSFEDISLPLGKREDVGILSLAEFFRLDKKRISAVDIEEQNGLRLNVLSLDGGSTRLYINSDTSLPLRIEGEAEGKPLLLKIIEIG